MKGVSELARPSVPRQRLVSSQKAKISAKPGSPPQSSRQPRGADHSTAALALSMVAVLFSLVSLVLQIHDRHTSDENAVVVGVAQQMPLQTDTSRISTSGYREAQEDMYAPR